MEQVSKTSETAFARFPSKTKNLSYLRPVVGNAPTSDQVDSFCASTKMNRGERNKWQPSLNQAIVRKDHSTVERLLRKGADINKPDPKDGFYPVVVAASFGSSSQVFHTVLQAKPDVNVTAPSGLRMSAISKCALNGDVDGVKMLLQAGASLGASPFWEHDPYMVVAGVEDWHPKFREYKEIQLILEDAAKLRDDYVALSE
jgi:hypothetical protein